MYWKSRWRVITFIAYLTTSLGSHHAGLFLISSTSMSFFYHINMAYDFLRVFKVPNVYTDSVTRVFQNVYVPVYFINGYTWV